VVGLAQTGTGKTAAFALPILSRLDLSQKTPQALVLAPTRELALQVCEAFEKYAATSRACTCSPSTAARAYGVQLSALRRGVHIVVGTPGRIMDHLEKGTLDLSELRFLVLDEADEMLNMGFAEDVETILADTPDDKQVALFSATMPSQIRRISKKYLNDPVEITVKNKTATAAEHHPALPDGVLPAEGRRPHPHPRGRELRGDDRLRPHQARDRDARREAARPRLLRRRDQRRRRPGPARAHRQPAQVGKLDILVATDVAARGLDVERISHVVNYDIPTDTESYVHRIGRTGRAGRSGDAISFVTPRERYLLKHIEKATRQPLTADAAAHASRTSTRPGWPASTTQITEALAGPEVETSSATSSPTTSASTTCPRSTWPPRSRRAAGRDPAAALEPEPRAPLRRPSRPRGPARPWRARRAGSPPA
jgi:ATP-dependent RNA helicase DeaD